MQCIHDRFLGFQRYFAYRFPHRTINSPYYFELLNKEKNIEIWGFLIRDAIVLHGIEKSSYPLQTRKKFKDLFWTVMKRPLYITDLPPCDYHMLVSFKEEQIYQWYCCGDVHAQLPGDPPRFFFFFFKTLRKCVTKSDDVEKRGIAVFVILFKSVQIISKKNNSGLYFIHPHIKNVLRQVFLRTLKFKR